MHIQTLGVLESEEIKQFFADFLGGPVLTFDFKVRIRDAVGRGKSVFTNCSIIAKLLTI